MDDGRKKDLKQGREGRRRWGGKDSCAANKPSNHNADLTYAITAVELL